VKRPLANLQGMTIGPRSFWLEEALRIDPGVPCPPLAGQITADVCVVGGGFAGLWTAYELTEREPSLDVVLLEADVCGAGGSGANGGLFSASWKDVAALCRFFGESEGIRYATALADEVAELGRWCRRHGADIAYRHQGSVFAQAGEWEATPSRTALELLEARGLGGRLRSVDAAEARRVADSPQFRGGAFSPDVATIQPARLARALRRVLLERGVRIFEGTPMRAFEPGVRVLVTSPGGSVWADQLVLTVGAWAASQPRFRRAFAVAFDYMVVTEPIPDRLKAIGWTSHVAIADSRENLYYLRKTEDGRVAIGGGAMGLAYGARIRSRAATSLRKAERAAEGLLWLFPQLEGVRFSHAWSGPMDMTASQLPFFTTLREGNVHAGLGFSGHGLAPTRVGGRTLASLVLRAEDAWSRMPVVGPPMSRLPPEPLRWPLLAAVSWALESGDRAEERGRKRGRARALVGSLPGAYRNRCKPRAPDEPVAGGLR
jgi:glycine/D-amino acid oxidase-like deaminating enzyme